MKQITRIDYKDIRPKTKGKADFFSWSLSEFIRRNPNLYRIYKTENLLFIGYKSDGWVCGSGLRSVCSYRKKIQTFAFPNSGEWEDVTDWFWAEYFKKGVCAIHDDLAHNFKHIGKTKRECVYCGKIEKRKTKITKSFIWVKER